jgi:hypothetical protein
MPVDAGVSGGAVGAVVLGGTGAAVGAVVLGVGAAVGCAGGAVVAVVLGVGAAVGGREPGGAGATPIATTGTATSAARPPPEPCWTSNASPPSGAAR